MAWLEWFWSLERCLFHFYFQKLRSLESTFECPRLIFFYVALTLAGSVFSIGGAGILRGVGQTCHWLKMIQSLSWLNKTLQKDGRHTIMDPLEATFFKFQHHSTIITHQNHITIISHQNLHHHHNIITHHNHHQHQKTCILEWLLHLGSWAPSGRWTTSFPCLRHRIHLAQICASTPSTSLGFIKRPGWRGCFFFSLAGYAWMHIFDVLCQWLPRIFIKEWDMIPFVGGFAVFFCFVLHLCWPNSIQLEQRTNIYCILYMLDLK